MMFHRQNFKIMEYNLFHKNKDKILYNFTTHFFYQNRNQEAN